MDGPDSSPPTPASPTPASPTPASPTPAPPTPASPTPAPPGQSSQRPSSLFLGSASGSASGTASDNAFGFDSTNTPKAARSAPGVSHWFSPFHKLGTVVGSIGSSILSTVSTSSARIIVVSSNALSTLQAILQVRTETLFSIVSLGVYDLQNTQPDGPITIKMIVDINGGPVADPASAAPVATSEVASAALLPPSLLPPSLPTQGSASGTAHESRPTTTAVTTSGTTPEVAPAAQPQPTTSPLPTQVSASISASGTAPVAAAQPTPSTPTPGSFSGTVITTETHGLLTSKQSSSMLDYVVNILDFVKNTVYSIITIPVSIVLSIFSLFTYCVDKLGGEQGVQEEHKDGAQWDGAPISVIGV